MSDHSNVCSCAACAAVRAAKIKAGTVARWPDESEPKRRGHR